MDLSYYTKLESHAVSVLELTLMCTVVYDALQIYEFSNYHLSIISTLTFVLKAEQQAGAVHL